MSIQPNREEVPEFHLSVRALVSVLSSVTRGSSTILDERPAESLLGWAMNSEPWIGPELFGFPPELDYFYGERGKADLAGYPPDHDWSNKIPTAQLEFKHKAQFNWPSGKRCQLDTYAAIQPESNHLVLMLPSFRVGEVHEMFGHPLFQSGDRWRLVTHETVLERLESCGVSELDSGSNELQMVSHLLRLDNRS